MTGVRHIAWWEPEFGTRESKLLIRVLESRFLNDGDVTSLFERKLARHLGAAHAVAVTSGTSAIFLALAGLGIGPGDEVLVPDITFIATANAVSLTGAAPVLVDVDPATLTLDANTIARWTTKRTKAVVPVHISGRAADMEKILREASKRNLYVVEDAAEALGSVHQGKFLGTLAHAGCFSFTANKIITSGQGGAVVTNDAALARRLRALKDQGRPVRGTGGADIHESVGYNFKYTNLQAAVALGQLACLRQRSALMREIYRAYRRGLAGIRGVSLLPMDVGQGEAPQWIDALVEDRDGLCDYLRSKEVHCRKFWLPLHTQKPYAQPDSLFPNATMLASKAVWLPSSFKLTGGDVQHVCRLVKRYLSRG